MDSTSSDRRFRPVLLIAPVIPLVIVAALLVAGRDGEPGAAVDPMFQMAPGGVVAMEDVPGPIVELYRGAEQHHETFAAVPCFCGCMDMLGHRHLLDCFERPDGSGWEAHALGCGVCLGEARQVLDLVEAGEPIDQIVTAVVTDWGDPYLTEE